MLRIVTNGFFLDVIVVSLFFGIINFLSLFIVFLNISLCGKFLIKFDIIKSIFNIFFDCLFVIFSSFCQIFIFLILQRNLLFVIEYNF